MRTPRIFLPLNSEKNAAAYSTSDYCINESHSLLHPKGFLQLWASSFFPSKKTTSSSKPTLSFRLPLRLLFVLNSFCSVSRENGSWRNMGSPNSLFLQRLLAVKGISTAPFSWLPAPGTTWTWLAKQLKGKVWGWPRAQWFISKHCPWPQETLGQMLLCLALCSLWQQCSAVLLCPARRAFPLHEFHWNTYIIQPKDQEGKYLRKFWKKTLSLFSTAHSSQYFSS